MEQISIFLFLILFFRLNTSTINVYTKNQIFNYLYAGQVSEDFLISIKNIISDVFSEIYAFNEISKNPPQPEFDKHYYQKIDFQKRINNINVKNTNIYKFYQELKLLFDELGDSHINLDMNVKELSQIFFSEPINLKIKMVNYKPKIFAELKSSLGDLIKYFKDYYKMVNIINLNTNTPIYSINGEDPFDFVSNFGGKYKYLKGPHGNFRHKFEYLKMDKNFELFPLSIDDLSNFNVVYENGENFSTDYIFYSSLDLNYFKNNDVFNQKIKSFINNIDDLKKNLIKQFTKKNLFFNNNQFIPKLKIFNLNQNNEYNYNNVFTCRVENYKKVNIYIVSSFEAEENPKYIETIKKCAELFDTNNYPIILFNYFNGGGMIYNSQFLLELLSPKTTTYFYGGIRNTKVIKDTDNVNYLLSSYYDYDKCESLNYKKLIKNTYTINYGNEVTDSLSGPIIINGERLRKEVNNFKKKLKNKRNPTEILVYTDGFSYSAAAMLLKYLQYYGGGITAGYFLNPNLENITYNSGISPSALFTHQILQYFTPTGYNILNEQTGIKVQVPGVQTFYTPYDLTRPLEYEITPVDEFIDFYYLDQDSYESLINKSLKIFEKYKTKCNPKNKKLLLISKECDGKFKNDYTHGGYKCGEDGIWTNICVASYCDIGYIFDHSNNKCIVDICSKSNSDSSSEPNKNKNNTLTIIIILVIIIFLIIIIIVCIVIRRRKRRRYNNIILEKSFNNTNIYGRLNIF